MSNKLNLNDIKNKKLLIMCSLACAVIIAGYIFLCIIAGGKDFIGDTIINGVNVSEMTKQEAILALEQSAKEGFGSLILSANNELFTINAENVLSFDAKKGVDEIYNKPHSSFFKQGILMFSNNESYIPLEIVDQEQLENAIKESGILDYNTDVPTTYNILDGEIEFTKGKHGMTVTLETVLKDMNDAFAAYKIKENIECTLGESKLSDEVMTTIHSELSNTCTNATLDKNNNYAIVPSKTGVSYDLEEAKKAFNAAEEGMSFKVSAKVVRPTITTEDLQKNLFKDLLGSYTTTVSGTASRKNNVKLSGSKCNGTILLPGEEFSYNNVVGKRTIAAGFGYGAGYVGGAVIDVVGGGICQTSSTIYNAAMLANLQITERKPHSYVSSYVPIGRDATVSWGSIDFKFKNNTAYPIKIVTSYVNDQQTVQIYGTNLENITVKITSQQLSTIPYNTVTYNDPNLAEGQTRVAQSGTTGATAQSYRYVYKNGVLISSGKEAYSTYKKRDKIVYVGAPVQNPVTPSDPVVPDNNVTDTTPTNPSTPELNENETNSTPNE